MGRLHHHVNDKAARTQAQLGLLTIEVEDRLLDRAHDIQQRFALGMDAQERDTHLAQRGLPCLELGSRQRPPGRRRATPVVEAATGMLHQPVLNAPIALLALLGLGLCLLRWRDPRAVAISLWFWIGFVGMVLTVEPGIYVRPADGVPEKFHNIGIRIEDDAIVTETGCELISRGVPVKAAEIEALMR